jgi:hypothetical protein
VLVDEEEPGTPGWRRDRDEPGRRDGVNTTGRSPFEAEDGVTSRRRGRRKAPRPKHDPRALGEHASATAAHAAAPSAGGAAQRALREQ